MKLLKIAPFLLLIALMSSCSKEKSIDTGGVGIGGGGGNPSSGSGIQGKWKLVSSSGTTSASSAFDVAGDEMKIETVLRYSSEKPVGVYNITASDFNGVGVGYDYNGVLIIRQYENNVLQSEDSTDVNMTIPPSNSTSKYKLIGSDSIYFEVGGPGTPSVSGNPAAPQSGGCKYKLEGTRLTLIMKMNQTQINNQSGIVTKDSQSANVAIVLEKQ